MASNSKQEGVLPRMWSAQHAANYMKLTGLLTFRIKEEAYNEPKLYQFLQEVQRQMQIQPLPPERYDQFLTEYRDYIEVEKPSFLEEYALLVRVSVWVYVLPLFCLELYRQARRCARQDGE